MHDFLVTKDQTQILIPLRVKPHTHKAVPTLTGSAFSYEAGTVLYGHYNMEYLLPGGDRLRLIANHNKKTVQLMLFTHDPELLKLLPGQRPASLVADSINTLHRYRTRSKSYSKPFTPSQQEKLLVTNEGIALLTPLLKKERALESHDHHAHEALRREVISIIEHCRDGNRQIANNPIVSEGSLGSILYDAHKAAQHHQFNRVYAVSSQDQMDFTDQSTHNGKRSPCFVWDSELHIGHNSDDLDDALRVICQQYRLIPAGELNNIPANRFEKLEAFFHKLWRDGHDWIEYLSIKVKPGHKTEIQHRSDGVSITKITPYYMLHGFSQKAYQSLNELVFHLSNSTIEGLSAQNSKEAKQLLSQRPNGHWAVVANKNQIVLRMDNQLLKINYFSNHGHFYPLPEGQDLYSLSQVSKRHLYLPERVHLRLNAFISRIPTFFKGFYKSLHQFIVHDLHEEFFNHVHANHTPSTPHQNHPQTSKCQSSLHEALENKGLLSNGQTLEQFIEEHLVNSPYVIARANHPPSPPAYENPLHRALGVLRHIAGFFVDTSERNPMIGTLAVAAYFYGAGAVLAPNVLQTLLTKLHLNGLISGIEPTQRLAHWMSHGTTSEAISASVTLWQGVVAGGNLDKFFVDAVSVLKDDPAEIAIIAALAIGLGYGITKAIPSLQQEMGEFALPNYVALGGKGGAAIYDTIMHPGDDWLLGTCKWLCKGVITLGKLLVAPFFEGYYYGIREGFQQGWKKTIALSIRTGKQILAASTDFILTLLTIPLLEISAVLIHVPFRGITNFASKILATLGNISTIGQALIRFAQRPSSTRFISEFKLSPLYGFNSLLGQFSTNPFINISINVLSVIFLPPFQLLKNLVILPCIDLLSLIMRLGLTVISPSSRLIALGLGTVLYTFGQVWDNSIGILFSTAATEFTLLWNWVDNQVGEKKQILLSAIEIKRGELYQWAFAEEDLRIHPILTDHEYYTSHPIRSEKIPHSSSHCLLHTLLKETHVKSPAGTQNSQNHYQNLFNPAEQLIETQNHLPQVLS